MSKSQPPGQLRVVSPHQQLTLNPVTPVSEPLYSTLSKMRTQNLISPPSLMMSPGYVTVYPDIISQYQNPALGWGDGSVGKACALQARGSRVLSFPEHIRPPSMVSCVRNPTVLVLR